MRLVDLNKNMHMAINPSFLFYIAIQFHDN